MVYGGLFANQASVLGDKDSQTFSMLLFDFLLSLLFSLVQPPGRLDWVRAECDGIVGESPQSANGNLGTGQNGTQLHSNAQSDTGRKYIAAAAAASISQNFLDIHIQNALQEMSRRISIDDAYAQNIFQE